jgi:hypothetical protein
MSPLKLLRIWLLALVVVLVGCGGHDDGGDIGDLDASSDARKSDVASDRATDAPGDNRDAATGDIRVDTPPTADVRIDTPVVDVRTDPTVDVRVDTPVIDVRVDTPVVDVRVDTPVVDVRVDTPVVDVRVDTPVVDVRVDTPVVDVRVDTPIDVARDADAAVDVTIDPTVDAGCSSDNQCGPTAPHCNTNTGACVSRVAVAVTPANPSIAAGTTQQFAATMTYSDTSTGDVTALATWQSSNTPVATMNAGTPGLASGVTQGVSTISAIFAGLAGGTQLTVTTATLQSIQVTPTNASSALGTTRQFTAIGTYSDTSTQDLTASAIWASSMTNVATIAAGGVATAAAIGPTTISATVGTTVGSTTFTVTAAVLVSINVTPANSTIATLTTQDFTATGIYTDNTTQNLNSQATWVSSDPTIATLNGTIATGIAAGTTNISATVQSITGSTPLHVTGATLTSIVVTPANPSAPVGFNVQFKATGNFSSGPPQDLTADVLWGSSEDANASISNAGGSEGLATALQAGTSTISATIAGQQGSTLFTITTSPLTSIEVLPAASSIALGTKQLFTATAHFMDGTTLDITTQVSWSSTALGVATVSNATGSKGLATSVNTGMTIIVASMGSLSGTTTLTVTPATLTSIAITPANTSTPVSTPLQYTARGTYSDTTTQDITTSVTWNSTDLGVATISSAMGSEGLATPVAAGMTTITATSGSVSGTTLLQVTP